MDVIEGWRALAEEVGPRLALPVASAIVVTLLWALTGWAAFDLTIWPWALGAIPIALLGALRLSAALARNQAGADALNAWTGAMRAVGRSLKAEKRDVARAALRVGRSRLGGRGVLDLAELLDADTHTTVRESSDPLGALLSEAESAGADAQAISSAHAALARCDALSVQAAPLARTGDLTLLFLVTLPVGLVTTTGWWTFLAMAGVSLAYVALDSLSSSLERSFGPGSSLPVEAAHADAERALGPRNAA